MLRNQTCMLYLAVGNKGCLGVVVLGFCGGGVGGYIIMLYFKGSQVGISQFGKCQPVTPYNISWTISSLLFLSVWENPSEYKGLN